MYFHGVFFSVQFIMATNNSFWINNPIIMVDKHNMFEVFPKQTMTYDDKLNAISRLVMYASIIGFITTKNMRFIVAGVITLVGIIIMYRTHANVKSTNIKEGFDSANLSQQPNDDNEQPSTSSSYKNGSLQHVMQKEFNPIQKDNPYGNVLISDIANNPTRKPAPPAFNNDVRNNIMEATENMVQSHNPELDVSKDVIGDSAQKYTLDRSSLVFHSMPCTQIPNNQGAYSQFLYGNIGSCKAKNMYQCNGDAAATTPV